MRDMKAACPTGEPDAIGIEYCCLLHSAYMSCTCGLLVTAPLACRLPTVGSVPIRCTGEPTNGGTFGHSTLGTPPTTVVHLSDMVRLERDSDADCRYS